MRQTAYAILIFGLFAIAFFVLGAVSFLGVIRVLIKRGIMTVTFNRKKEPHV